MRHHPKSNNGVFSKKQTKASRFMMANHRRDIPFKSTNLNLNQPSSSPGMLAAVLGMLKRAARKRG